MKKSEKLIRDALDAVSKDRPSTHGDASLNFKITAILWNAYDKCVDMVDREQNEVDVPQKMVLAKMARMLAGDPTFDDHYVDQIGYSAIAGQLASLVKEPDVANSQVSIVKVTKKMGLSWNNEEKAK